MQNLKDKQDTFIRDVTKVCSIPKSEARQRLKEIIECVCDKMIGKPYISNEVGSYNERIKEEQEIKKQIIKELK